MRGATVSIYRNRKTGAIRVHPYAREYGTPQEYGSPVYLSSDASDEDIVRTVLTELKKTETQKYDSAKAPRYSAEQQEEILKNDKTLTIVETKDGLRVIPLMRARGSFASVDEKIEIIPANEFLASGGAVIRRILDDIP